MSDIVMRKSLKTVATYLNAMSGMSHLYIIVFWIRDLVHAKQFRYTSVHVKNRARKRVDVHITNNNIRP